MKDQNSNKSKSHSGDKVSTKSKENMMSKAWKFSIALMIFAVIAEIAIITYTWMYEASVVPPGVFTMLGLSGVGATLVVIELLKLPLALHIAGSGRIGKVVGLFGLALLCLVTWHAIKDMFTNEIIVSLEPSRQLVKQADELEARNAALELILDNIQEAGTDSNMSRDGIIEQAEKLLVVQEGRRSVLVEQFKTQVDELQSASLLTPAEQSRKAQLLATRDRIESDAEYKMDEVESLIQAEVGQNSKAAEAVRVKYEHKLAAWEAQVQAMQAQNIERVSAWKAETEALASAHEVRVSDYKQVSSGLKAEIKSIQDALDAEVRMHHENDALFYGAAAKIAAAQKRAEDRLIPLRKQLVDLGSAPVLSLPPSPASATLPPRPQLSSDENVALKQFKDRRGEIVSGRDGQLAEVDAKLQILMDGALARVETTGASKELEQKLASVYLERDQALASVDQDIRQIHEQRQEQLQQLNGIANNAVIRLEETRDARDEITANTETISSMRLDAEERITETNVYRMAAVLEYFMPEKSVEDRMAFFQSAVLPIICFFPAFLPAFFLEISASRLSPKPPSPPKRPRGLGYFRRSKERFRTRTKQMASAQIELATNNAQELVVAEKQAAAQLVEKGKDMARTLVDAEKDRAGRQIDAAKDEVAAVKQMLRQKDESHAQMMLEIETNAAQQIMQAHSDADRKVIEAQAKMKIAESKVELADEKNAFVLQQADSRVNEISAVADENARKKVDSEVDRLKKIESDAALKQAQAQLEVKVLREQERENNQVIKNMREDIADLAQRQMSLTVIDSQEQGKSAGRLVG